MDERDQIILSFGMALKANWSKLKASRAVGDAKRAAALIIAELEKRGYRIERAPGKRRGHSTPG